MPSAVLRFESTFPTLANTRLFDPETVPSKDMLFVKFLMLIVSHIKALRFAEAVVLQAAL